MIEDTPSVEFYFDYGSPNAYMAYGRLPAIAARTGARVVPRPMLLGAVLKATNNFSPAEIPAKRPNSQRDLRRFSNKYAVPYAYNPHFPINTLHLMRGAMAAEASGILERYSAAVWKAMWVDMTNLGDRAAFRRCLAEARIDPDLIEQASATEAVKERLKEVTAAALARGVFGAPTFFVGEEMFFGNDRLCFVEEALTGRSYLDAPAL